MSLLLGLFLTDEIGYFLNLVQLQVKVLKKPRFDINKLLELHGDGSGATVVDESGVQVERAEGYEPPVQESV